MLADQLVATRDELLAVWSSDIDRLTGPDHVALALGEHVPLGDSHFPALQVRHPIPCEAARARTAGIERERRHAAKGTP